jgi:hypothetical protein
MSTQEKLRSISDINPINLARNAELGEELNFQEAVGPLSRCLNVVKWFADQSLDNLSESELETIVEIINHIQSCKMGIENFTTTSPESVLQRDSIIAAIKKINDEKLALLSPAITISMTDEQFAKARETKLTKELHELKQKAVSIVAEAETKASEQEKLFTILKERAAEDGVTQHAIHFKGEADMHKLDADKWRTATIWIAAALACFAALSLFVHKISFLDKADPYASFQLALSKVLIFSVLAFWLILAARNFLSHKHNVVVNRHRQNALLTFQELALAAQTPENRDIVLTQASACIFSPQETGYIRSQGQTQPEIPVSVVQMLTKQTQ